MKKWLHANKTNFVIFHSHAKKFTEPIALNFGHKNITHADHVSFLGVLLDETPGWKHHLVELSRKLPGQLEFSINEGIMFPLDSLKFVYYALFHIFLNYGVIVWGSTFENLLNPVHVAQKSLLRAMTFSDPIAHSSPLFYDLKILKLYDLHQLSISVFACE